MEKFLKVVKENRITLSFFGVFLVADFVTKYLVEKKIHFGARIDVFGSFVQLTKLYNEGGVFGILQGYKNTFLVVSLIVFCIMIAFYVYEKNKTVVFKIAMGLIFSGAVGNILDRVAGKPGVVDFIYIGVDGVYRWPAFNVADAAIVVGATLLLYTFFKHSKKKADETVE